MIHKMKLNNGPFEQIKIGTKTIEMRLNDEKRQFLNVGDLIEFENRNTLEKITVIVVALHKFSNFKELYEYFDKGVLGYNPDDEAIPSDMEQYYSNEEINKYGVLGIEIKLC